MKNLLKKLTKVLKNDFSRLAIASTSAIAIPIIGMSALVYSHLSTYAGEDEACEIARGRSAVSELQEHRKDYGIPGVIAYPVMNLFANSIDAGSSVWDRVNCQRDN